MAIHFYSEQLDHAARALQAIPEGVARAAVPALNRASLAGKTYGVRKMMATYATKRTNVARTVTMVRATRSSLVAGFSSRGSRMPLTSFQVLPGRPTTRGQQMTVAVRKDSSGKSISRGFVNRLKGGSRLAVLQREGSARYPVKMLFGPAVPQMLGEEGVREEIESRASQVLASRFDHEIGRLMKGLLS
jgi:hypothetical protein